MNGAYYKEKRPRLHCEIPTLSNLVMLRWLPDRRTIISQLLLVYTTSLSLTQRWLRRYELICWESQAENTVDMPLVHRLSPYKPLNGSYRARVGRRTKYSREAETNHKSIVSLFLSFFKAYDLVVSLIHRRLVSRWSLNEVTDFQKLMTFLPNLFSQIQDYRTVCQATQIQF